MPIKVGDRLPNVKFRVMTAEGPAWKTTDDIFKGKKVALFAVPGAFTGVCSKQHLPSVVANVDAEPKRDAGSAIEALVRQVSAPVQWEAVVRRLASEGVTTYVEVGSGTVLSGLVRKIHAEARLLQFGSPGDLEAVVAACSI